MKKIYIASLVALALFIFAACGKDKSSSNTSQATGDSSQVIKDTSQTSSENPYYDPHRGEGKFHDYDPGSVNSGLVAKGESVYESKCQSCHKLSDESLVGPGWKGVTDKHSVDWILNFLTNTDAMLDGDPELQDFIEICMIRMPYQNLTDDDAKGIYDFMRENDKK